MNKSEVYDDKYNKEYENDKITEREKRRKFTVKKKKRKIIREEDGVKKESRHKKAINEFMECGKALTQTKPEESFFLFFVCFLQKN